VISNAPIHQNSTDSTPNPDPALSPAQAEVAAALARGETITAAAEQAGVHRTTVHHWLRHEPEFKTAVLAARREYVETVNDELRELAARALQTLRKLLDDPTTAPALQLKAALAILQRSQSWNLSESPDPEPHAAGPEVTPEKAPRVSAGPVARNAPCPCGSGTKYKRCCGSRFPTPPVSPWSAPARPTSRSRTPSGNPPRTAAGSPP
jgi:hypothetical protein